MCQRRKLVDKRVFGNELSNSLNFFFRNKSHVATEETKSLESFDPIGGGKQTGREEEGRGEESRQKAEMRVLEKITHKSFRAFF